MIVDSSVLAAILFGEPERADFASLLISTPTVNISAGNWLELTIVFVRRGRPDLVESADQLRAELDIKVSDVTGAQVEIGRDAYQRYGRGTKHAADLNYGDCFAYALAKVTGEPLLFKGNDFNHTDLALHNAAAYPR